MIGVQKVKKRITQIMSKNVTEKRTNFHPIWSLKIIQLLLLLTYGCQIFIFALKRHSTLISSPEVVQISDNLQNYKMVKKVISKEAKVNTNLKTRKVPTKLKLEFQVKNVQQANNALEEVKRKNIKLFESFEEKISNLETQIEHLSCKESMLSKETQTEAKLN